MKRFFLVLVAAMFLSVTSTAQEIPQKQVEETKKPPQVLKKEAEKKALAEEKKAQPEKKGKATKEAPEKPLPTK